MARAEVKLIPPVPVKRQIDSITLVLSEIEAIALRTLTGSVIGAGHHGNPRAEGDGNVRMAVNSVFDALTAAKIPYVGGLLCEKKIELSQFADDRMATILLKEFRDDVE